MKNLELLKEQSKGHKCSNCKKRENKVVAKSMNLQNVYYTTCSACGNVSVVRVKEFKDGNVEFVVNETAQKNTISTEAVMFDAAQAYKEAGYPIMHSCINAEEAKKYLEELEKAREEEIEDMEEDYFDDEIEDIEVESVNNNVVTDKDKMYLIDDGMRMEKYWAKDLEELQGIIESNYHNTNNLEIYEIAREISIEKKIVLK